MVRVTVTGALCVGIMASAVGAEELPAQKEARKMLFGTRGAEAVISQSAGLSAQDIAILEQVAQTQKYYGAIAFSPDDGLLNEATVAATNYHKVEPARAAALKDCNAKRGAGTAACVIGADIVPRRYEPGRALQLSIDATFSVGKSYRRIRGEKAFAASPATGHYGMGVSDGEALSACADKGASDCEIVIRN